MTQEVSEIVKLVQFPSMFGVPNMSPYCMKVETFMRITGIPYEVVQEMNPGNSPKGKLPYIIHRGKKVPDSSFILEYLSNEFNVDLDSHLSVQEKAVSHAFQRLFEESLVWVMMYRGLNDSWDILSNAWFGSIPAFIRTMISASVKKRMQQKLIAQGLGVHNRDEVYHYGMKDLRAIIDQLGAKPFFMGDRVSQLDTTAYAFVSALLIEEIKSPLDELSKTAENLRAYKERMQSLYFPEFNLVDRAKFALV